VAFLDRFVGLLSRRFVLKHLDSIHHFLGVEVVLVYGEFFLSQSPYITNILPSFRMDAAKSIITLMSAYVPLTANDSATVDDASKVNRLTTIFGCD